MRPIRRMMPFALCAALLAGGVANAQTVSWNPRTGDVWVDTWLGDMNQYGARYRDPFVDEMVRYYGAPRDYVSGLLTQQRWSPGDVYMACSIAHILGRPCSYVVDQYTAMNREQPGQGWGVMAQRLGIKPGSAQFHRMKSGMVRSYDRWDRPIVIDRDLERTFPGRGKGADKAQGNRKPHAQDARPHPQAKPKGGKPEHAGGHGKGHHGGKPEKAGGKGKGNTGKGRGD